MYEMIEDLYFLKANPKQKCVTWFLSAGNHKAIITSLRFGLPIILSMTSQILQEMKVSKDQTAAISMECEHIKKSFEEKLQTSIEDLENRLSCLQDRIYDQNQREGYLL